jgi:hypothetical protein
VWTFLRRGKSLVPSRNQTPDFPAYSTGRNFTLCLLKSYSETDIISVLSLDHSAAFLIISNRHSILVADLKEQGLERVPIIVENVVATASNMHTGTIFWSDMKLKKISRLDRGSEPQEVSCCKCVPAPGCCCMLL